MTCRLVLTGESERGGEGRGRGGVVLCADCAHIPSPSGPHYCAATLKIRVSPISLTPVLRHGFSLKCRQARKLTDSLSATLELCSIVSRCCLWWGCKEGNSFGVTTKIRESTVFTAQMQEKRTGRLHIPPSFSSCTSLKKKKKCVLLSIIITCSLIWIHPETPVSDLGPNPNPNLRVHIHTRMKGQKLWDDIWLWPVGQFGGADLLLPVCGLPRGSHHQKLISEMTTVGQAVLPSHRLLAKEHRDKLH